ncbi:uncharacterized protein LOC113154464 [Anabas testudineus]|uniref:uncharacterized protein LOC113154464 n=1 Tax=Anabas testudineus TaxID=64144 RepID=UPI000E4648CB|nr:uncharacterized protein LOC113154464 [Anabas testudineus]
MASDGKNYCLSAAQRLDLSNFPQSNGKTARDYLASVSDFVLKNKGKRYVLKNPVGATLRIAALDDTIYRDDNDVVNGWGKFYLPKTVNMQVFAIVEGVSCPCDQLVLMTCEEKKVYGYDEEGLHLVATSLDWLRVNGLKYPPLKTYYKGEAFKDMTEEDWAKLRKGAVGRRLDEEHAKLVAAKKSRFLENLRNTRHKTEFIR